MRVVIIAVGKVKEKHLRTAVDEYLKRIKRYARVEEIELKDGDAAEVRARFEKAIPDRSRVIALEVEGKSITSAQFAKWIDDTENSGVQSLVFLIGGSYGLPPEISRAAHQRLSLSAMILPHRLARLFLAEQVYRAFTISRNEPYSH